jgi:hypothetical protein
MDALTASVARIDAGVPASQSSASQISLRRRNHGFQGAS